ncbi:LPXTG cell wall anchor domain-containing protein [Lactococcus garvieae]|nr:LPXTG cell wall anchor domain-containing protein [Lactococcus garvieae]
MQSPQTGTSEHLWVVIIGLILLCVGVIMSKYRNFF